MLKRILLIVAALSLYTALGTALITRDAGPVTAPANPHSIWPRDHRVWSA